MTLDFSKLQTVELSVIGPDGDNYILREANGRAAKIFNNARISGVTLEDGKPKSLSGIGDLEPLLVSLCLFGENDRPLTVSFVEKWPSRVVKKLYNKAREISDLDEGEMENELVTALKKCLDSNGSPMSYVQFKSYVEATEDSAVEPLRDLLATSDSPEERAKNLLENTTDGSE
jgi:hypothetical protein